MLTLGVAGITVRPINPPGCQVALIAPIAFNVGLSPAHRFIVDGFVTIKGIVVLLKTLIVIVVTEPEQTGIEQLYVPGLFTRTL